MENQSLFVLKVICWGIASFAGILATWFEARDRWQTDEEREKTRKWYGQKWMRIQESGLLKLPEKAIAWLLNVKIKTAKDILFRLTDLLAVREKVFIGLNALVGILGAYFVFGWMGFMIAGYYVCFTICTPGLLRLFHIKSDARIIMILMIAFASPIFSLLWVKFALSLPIVSGTILMTTTFPFIGMYMGWGIMLIALPFKNQLGSKNIERWYIFGWALIASFLLTLLFLTVGHFSVPKAWVPKTIQMLFSNVICDGLTMLVTIEILTWVIYPHRELPVRVKLPIAIFLDVIIAAVLACASLWFGLVGTVHALTVRETINVLFAQAPDGAHLDFGPFFWAMHTTFIPTLLYFSLILLCWVGKWVILPVAMVLSRSEKVPKPHHLTAGVFAFVATIFLVLATGMGYVQEFLKSPGS